MAHHSNQTSLANLRAITYRLTSTPTKQLPQLAPQVAASLWHCRGLLSTSAEVLKQNNDASTTVHRLKTRLSTLLQDRTVEGRWAAVVLLKATIEAGGVETLSKSNAWVRGLLGVLKKPDPSTTRTLAIITLTRIFVLTWDYSNLVREITTPALPAFISTCLNNVGNRRYSANELQTVLEAFITLLPRHPTIFRTNESHIQSLLIKIVSQTSSEATESHFSQDNQDAAQRLLVLLHYSAPKQTAAQKYDETLSATLASAHATCDRLFRSVIEGWQSTTNVQPSLQASALLQGDMEAESDTVLGLSGWKGVFAASERLMALLELLKAHLITSTAGPVNVRLGLLADLLARVFSLRRPFGKGDTVQVNMQISRDERDAMFNLLPTVHVAGANLVRSVLDRFGAAAVSISQPFLAQMTWVFEAESSQVDFRAAAYDAVRIVLELQGGALSKVDVGEIDGIIKACCQDLVPADGRITATPNPNPNTPQTKEPVAYGDLTLQASSAKASHPVELRGVEAAAKRLLAVAFAKVDASHLPKRLRQLMDYTAVVTRDKDALIASVLNPAAVRGQPSLLPFLAKQHPESLEVEALLRPRMPPIKMDRSNKGNEETEDEEDIDRRDDVVLDQNQANPSSVWGAENGGDEDDEPTAGLLSALDQQGPAPVLSRDGSDLYSVSPQRRPQPAVVDSEPTERTSDKRNANEELHANHTAKRLRAAPIAETLLPDAADSLPGPDPVTAGAGVPTTVVVEQPSSSFVTAPEPSQQTATLPAAPTTAFAGDTGISTSAGDAGSDSDFEMPPLTMDSDTDPEDEDEDDDGGV